MDPVEILDRVNNVVNDVIISLRQKGVKKLKAIGFTSFVMNLLGVDDHGEPLTPCYTYAGHQLSLRSTEEALRKAWSREDHLRTGAVIHASYATVQLSALTNSSLDFDLKSIYKWQTLSSFIISKWTGQIYLPISVSEASWTGLVNFRECSWDPYALQIANISPLQLPPLVDSMAYPVRSALATSFLEKWPEMQNCCLFLGIGDGAVASLGSYCDSSNRIAVTIGTSCAARIMVDMPRQHPNLQYEEPQDKSSVANTERPEGRPPCPHPALPPEGLWCYRVDEQRVIVGGALTDGGSLIAWLQGLIGDERLERARRDLDRYIFTEDIEQLKKYPTALPFWSGERCPGWHSLASGTITGLTRSSDATGILFAVKESVAIRLGDIIGQMMAAGLVPPPRPPAVDPHRRGDGISSARATNVDEEEAGRGTGGGSVVGGYELCVVGSGKSMRRSRAWRQLLADVTGIPVVRLSTPGEATSRGLASLVLRAVAGVGPQGSDVEVLYPSPSGGSGTVEIEGLVNIQKRSALSSLPPPPSPSEEAEDETVGGDRAGGKLDGRFGISPSEIADVVYPRPAMHSFFEARARAHNELYHRMLDEYDYRDSTLPATASSSSTSPPRPSVPLPAASALAPAIG